MLGLNKLFLGKQKKSQGFPVIVCDSTTSIFITTAL